MTSLSASIDLINPDADPEDDEGHGTAKRYSVPGGDKTNSKGNKFRYDVVDIADDWVATLELTDGTVIGFTVEQMKAHYDWKYKVGEPGGHERIGDEDFSHNCHGFTFRPNRYLDTYCAMTGLNFREPAHSPPDGGPNNDESEDGQVTD